MGEIPIDDKKIGPMSDILTTNGIKIAFAISQMIYGI
jgi:hypothetical protein